MKGEKDAKCGTTKEQYGVQLTKRRWPFKLDAGITSAVITGAVTAWNNLRMVTMCIDVAYIVSFAKLLFL